MSSYLKMVQAVTTRYNEKINKACDWLFRNFNLNHFWYYKLTNKGYISFLGAQAAWGEYFASEKFYLKYPYLRHPKYLQEGIYLHSNPQHESLQQIYGVSRDKFDLRMSLQVLIKTSDGVEEFGFSSSSSDEIQTAVFLNELSVFRLFIKKFREDNQFLFWKLEDNQIDLIDLMGPTFYENDVPIHKPAIRQTYLKKMGIENPLTSREIDVVKLLLKGYSAGEISPRIYISKRTVEHHIERIKEKLSCYSRSDLIQKARELENFGYLTY